MKVNKSALAVAILSTLSTGAFAATVYQTDDTTLKLSGRVEGRGNFSEANDVDDNGNFKDKSRVRINLEGETKVADGVAFYGRYENEIKDIDTAGSDSPEAITTRYMQTGLKTNVGNFYYGRHQNATTFMTDWTDLAEVYSGYVNENDALTSDRSEGNLRYEMKNNGMTLNLGLVNNEAAEGYGLSFGYEFENGLGLAAAYTDSEQDEYGVVTDADTSTGMVAAKYGVGNFYMAAMFEMGSTDYNNESSDFTAIDAYVGYNFADNGTSYHNVNLTYNYFEHDESELSGMDVDNIGVEYAYHMKNTTVYAAYMLNMVDADDYALSDQANDEDEFMLGIKYQF